MLRLTERILESRGLIGELRDTFLSPKYEHAHNPFLLPDMRAGVDRLKQALEKQERITIYGDYDIDGLTATALLLDAFSSFGFKHVNAFMPNRFIEGYGLTVDAIEKIAKTGAGLIVTVDCGSLSKKEIIRANELGIDVIVTDHHNVAEKQPPAVAVINPKRIDHKYPFTDLAGVGVAFKLVQALQTELDGLEKGAEKWLLDLVALGTVCDVVGLQDENRANVYWGLKVLAKTRRPGLRALMAVAGVDTEKLTSRSLGFVLGPRMNASGRLETAQYALDMLTTKDPGEALRLAQQLDEMNKDRRKQQDVIMKEAVLKATEYHLDPVLVVSGKGWNHGIIGIVAAKLLELYKKPTFVLEEMKIEAKGSARSYGDFSAADAIKSAKEIVTKGGGHKLAAGVTLPLENIDRFRKQVNEYYRSLKLKNQSDLLLPIADTDAALSEVSEDYIREIAQLEPFGNKNTEPILRTNNLLVMNVRTMGADSQHVKITVQDGETTMSMLAFSAPEEWSVVPGDRVDVWHQPMINEWKGKTSVESRILRLDSF